MSWLASLSETYDNFYGGAYEQTGDRIVPVGFITKDVLFTVLLDADGNFRGAVRNEKKTVRPMPPDAPDRLHRFRFMMSSGIWPAICQK